MGNLLTFVFIAYVGLPIMAIMAYVGVFIVAMKRT